MAGVRETYGIYIVMERFLCSKERENLEKKPNSLGHSAAGFQSGADTLFPQLGVRVIDARPSSQKFQPLINIE